jgi:AcrR family transcriptional regulator
MDNSLRSQRTRDAAIQAALTIITRDGPGRLTIDAIARESGISKGGVLHQFRTKEAVLKALLEFQIEKGDATFQKRLSEMHEGHAQPVLGAQISSLRVAAAQPTSTTFALAGAVGDNPDLLEGIRRVEGERVEQMKEEADDPRMALIRWSAAKGLALAAILGICPLSEAEREDLFNYLQDESAWETTPKADARRKKAAGHGGKSART